MTPRFFRHAKAVACLALLVACSSNNTVVQNNGGDGGPTPGPSSCKDADCLPGNICLPLDGVVKCRKTCSSNFDPQTNCPTGYTCTAPNAGGSLGGECTGVGTSPGDVAAFDKPECPQKICVADARDGLATYCSADCSNSVCPDGYICRETLGDRKVCVKADSPFCVKDGTDAPKAKGQWGDSCNPVGGITTNPDCDTANGFYCYATRKSDAAAYCTHYACETDRDCKAGFFCGDANVSPSAESDAFDPGNTQKVCLKREYCAPCKADLDCPLLAGKPQHCINGDDGKAFCTPECAKTANCQKDARCADTGNGFNVCYPLAGVCVGDGTICSPCRSDADCKDGACVRGQYTEEKSCAVKSGKPCVVKTSTPQTAADYDCPTPTGAVAKVPIRCLGGPVFSEVPKNYCHGLYGFGESADVGCYTPKKP